MLPRLKRPGGVTAGQAAAELKILEPWERCSGRDDGDVDWRGGSGGGGGGDWGKVDGR